MAIGPITVFNKKSSRDVALELACKAENEYAEAREKAGLPEELRAFFTAAEVDALNEQHAAALARLKPPAGETDKERWIRKGWWPAPAQPSKRGRDLDPRVGLLAVAALLNDPRYEPEHYRQFLRPLLVFFGDDEPVSDSLAAAIGSWLDMSVPKPKRRRPEPDPEAIRAKAIEEGAVVELNAERRRDPPGDKP